MASMDYAPDELDRRLIALLQANARASTATLARRLGVARTTIVARLARLEASGVIVGYTVRLAATEGEQGVQAFVSLMGCRTGKIAQGHRIR